MAINVKTRAEGKKSKEKIHSIYRKIKEAYKRYMDYTEYRIGIFPISQFFKPI